MYFDSDSDSKQNKTKHPKSKKTPDHSHVRVFANETLI